MEGDRDMSDIYTPPFVMTEEITNLVIEIGEQLIHAGFPANYVPELVGQLFDWMRKSKQHPLVKSCIFHYEFEFIHPFADGNGRIGRLWQSLILRKWKEFFAWMPIETLIYTKQDGKLSASTLASTVGLTDRQVERILSRLKADGKIVRHGATKNGYWEVCCTDGGYPL